MILEGRIVWPALFEPRAFDANSTPKYSCSLLIEKASPQAAEVIKAVQAVIDDGLGGQRPDERNFPVKDGDAEGANPAFAGCLELRCKNTRKPGVVDAKLQQVIDPDLIRGGDHVKVDVNPYAYTRITRGIGLSLNNVQFVSKGAPIGAAAKRPEDVFESIATGNDETAQVDPNSFFS